MNTVLSCVRVGVLMAALAAAGWASVVQAQPLQQPQPQPELPLPVLNVPVPATTEAPAAAAQARVHERAQLRQQRHAIDAALQKAEAACYQRFAVEDCLQRERRRARQATAPLAQRERALDEAERRERAALRHSDLAERQQKQPPPVPVGPARVRNPEAVPDVLLQERAYEAQERAQRLQQKQQQHAAEQAEQVPQRAAAAEKARLRQEEKRQAAERRRARALEAQQRRAASGRQPPAALDPLP